MAYKMKGFSGFGTSPAKQKTIKSTGKGATEAVSEAVTHKTLNKIYPKSYTKKDIEFLKKQREDVVRYEDLDGKGKAIWKKQGKPIPKKKKEHITGHGYVTKRTKTNMLKNK